MPIGIDRQPTVYLSDSCKIYKYLEIFSFAIFFCFLFFFAIAFAVYPSLGRQRKERKKKRQELFVLFR